MQGEGGGGSGAEGGPGWEEREPHRSQRGTGRAFVLAPCLLAPSLLPPAFLHPAFLPPAFLPPPFPPLPSCILPSCPLPSCPLLSCPHLLAFSLPSCPLPSCPFLLAPCLLAPSPVFLSTCPHPLTCPPAPQANAVALGDSTTKMKRLTKELRDLHSRTTLPCDAAGVWGWGGGGPAQPHHTAMQRGGCGCVGANPCIPMCTCTHIICAHARACMHAHTHAYMHTHDLCKRTSTHALMHARAHHKQ